MQLTFGISTPWWSNCLQPPVRSTVLSWHHRSDIRTFMFSFIWVHSFHISSSRSVFLPVNGEWWYQNRSFPLGLPELFCPDRLLTGQDLLPYCRHSFWSHTDLLVHFSDKVLVPLNQQCQYVNSLLVFPWASKRGVLVLELPCQMPAKQKPVPDQSHQPWSGRVCVGKHKLSLPNTPRAALEVSGSVTDIQDSAGAGTSELTHT